MNEIEAMSMRVSSRTVLRPGRQLCAGTARIFAAILIGTLIALALFGIVSLFERILVPWAPRRGTV